MLLPQGLKVAVIEGHDIGGTCVNRGCVPSKALLAASGRVRDMKNTHHLKSIGIKVNRKMDLWKDPAFEPLMPCCCKAVVSASAVILRCRASMRNAGRQCYV